MVNEKILEEKLKYLIIMESKKKFEILQFDLFIDYEDDKSDRISSYDINIKFEYEGGISGSPTDFFNEIKLMIGEMSNYVETYIITPEGKLSQAYYDKYSIMEMIYGVNFLLDERQEFIVNFRIMHDV